MTLWVVAGFAVLIGLVVAAMFALAGRRSRATISFPHVPNSGCNGSQIRVTFANPDPDLWAPEDWL